MKVELFEEMYKSHGGLAGPAPWDISRPQDAIADLADAGEVQGSVLEVGCGTGEIALLFASYGHDTWGVDFSPTAIERAKARAIEQGLSVRFLVGDALELEKLGRSFDTLIDCGLFHSFSDDDQRQRYADGAAAVCNPGGVLYLMCISDLEPPGDAPRRVSQDEIRAFFHGKWQIERIVPTHFDVVPEAAALFSPGGPKAWLATIRRT